tara:strand:- start:317 stop:526 length:210 start_codon:yes stop_codon:yes gene_type:complete
MAVVVVVVWCMDQPRQNFLLKTAVQVVALQQYEMRLVVVQQLLVKEMTVVTVRHKTQTSQAEEVVVELS